MNDHQKKVLDFHTVFGLTIGRIPGIPSEKDVLLRDNLISEESKEFSDASKDKNLTEIADALADILYVVYGAANTYGIDIDSVFNEVHRSNMSKTWNSEEKEEYTAPVELEFFEVTGNRFVAKRKSDGKIIKSPSYSAADINWSIKGI